MVSMDISRYAESAEDIDVLSAYQIANFFNRHQSVTQADCHRTAGDLIGNVVSPTPVQGETSYTVAAVANERSKVVQIRHSALSLKRMSQARRTYREFVPRCQSRGMLADLYVYEMDLVPGVAFSQARRQLFRPDVGQRLLQTVQNFARFIDFYSPYPQYYIELAVNQIYRFFASAWINRPTLDQPSDTSSQLFTHYSIILDRLSQRLPERFQQKLKGNIHVDEGTGHITGIVDWADAKIAPFGTSLGGLETILGVQTSAQWIFHPNHEFLRTKFWEAFYGVVGHVSEDDHRAIEIGRLFGLFRTYGFGPTRREELLKFHHRLRSTTMPSWSTSTSAVHSSSFPTPEL